MKKKTRKKWLIWGTVAVVIILIIFAVNKGGNNKGIRVTIEEVESRTLTETVSANGKIESDFPLYINNKNGLERNIHKGDETIVNLKTSGRIVIIKE